MACQHCGAVLAATTTGMGVCLECGVTSQPFADSLFRKEETQERTEAPAIGRPLTFTGTTGEFFRIWIVNIFLTIITLGIYNAWAKVRTRRYFYANTHLAGHSFDYLADPINILKGNLVIGAGLIIYNLTDAFAPLWSLLLIGIFALVFPYLAYQSLRFRARYSSYRNIRFGFHGTLKESYKVYLLIPLLTPFTLGLIIPYFLFRQKEYAFSNFAFGQTKAVFGGEVERFYKIYIPAALCTLLLYAVGFILIYFHTLKAYLHTYDVSIFAVVIPVYLGTLVAFTLIQEYIYVRVANYCYLCTSFGEVGFRSTLKVRDLAWIRVTNILAILLSLGLLIPWAKVRRTRYIVENLSVIMREGDLDDFVADESEYQSALGDVAADAFDIEIGL